MGKKKIIMCIHEEIRSSFRTHVYRVLSRLEYTKKDISAFKINVLPDVVTGSVTLRYRLWTSGGMFSCRVS